MGVGAARVGQIVYLEGEGLPCPGKEFNLLTASLLLPS